MKPMKRQRGFSLVIFLLLLLAGSAVLAMRQQERQQQQVRVNAYRVATGLQQICAAGNTWTTRNWASLNPGAVTPLSASLLANTPPLSPEVLTTLQGITWQAQVAVVGSPGAYRSDVQVTTQGFKLPSGQPNLALASLVGQRLGVNGSVDIDGAGFRGFRGASVTPNPTHQAGAVLYRCGDANEPTREVAMRGNAGLTGTLQGGSQLVMGLSIHDAKQVQISQQVQNNTPCGAVGAQSTGADGKLYQCNGTVWTPSIKSVTQTQQQDTYQTISLPGDGG